MELIQRQVLSRFSDSRTGLRITFLPARASQEIDADDELAEADS